jgi:Fic family protein
MNFIPAFTITHSITADLVKIERARGFLEAARLSDEWVAKMQAKTLILEAHYTTHIEGTHLTLDQSEQLLTGHEVANADPEDVRELLNYKKAFELVADYLGSGDEAIREGLIREIHKRLVEGVRGNSALPGEYRKIQNYVANSKTKEIIYTPPPAYQVSLMMSELVDWLKQEQEINPVLMAGIAQFQLVHIHPFLDGNGRTARLLSTLYLYKTGYDFKRLFTISEYYDRDRSNYYKAIQSVRENNMDMTTWLEFFVHGLATQLQEIQNRGQQIMKLDILTIQHDLSKREKQAIEQALDQNGLSIKEFQLLFPDTSKRTLQRELKHLLDLELLKVEGATNDRRYFVNL